LRVINLEALAAFRPHPQPYLHFIGDNVLRAETAPAILADFPSINETGFFPVSTLNISGAFGDLVADTEDPAFSAAVGEKLELDLVHKPRLATLRHWSAASDGRIHTDSVSKIATVLIYLNESWLDSGAGRLRVLRNGKDFEDYSTEISPVLGSIFGFRRADNSWHGHLPFAGERKVLQITWLTDESKLARKTQTAKISRWLKRLNPFG
jgi:SM-20-related protein